MFILCINLMHVPETEEMGWEKIWSVFATLYELCIGITFLLL